MESEKAALLRSRFLPEGSYRRKIIDQLSIAGVANIIAKTLLAPLERWRIITQTQVAYPLRMKKFKGFSDFITRVPAEQGYMSLWRGNFPHCWIYLYQAIFQIAVYDSFRTDRVVTLKELSDSPALVWFYDNLLFPFVVSVLALAVIQPLDTYRIHTAMSYHKNKNDALFLKFRERIAQVQSVKDMYKGYWLAVVISLINFNFYRHVGSALSSMSTAEGSFKQLANPEVIASILAVAVVHPLDTFKKIFQLNNMSKPPIFSGYKSAISFLRENSSLSVLYKGFAVSMLKTILFMPIYMLIYQQWAGLNSAPSKEIENRA